MKKLSAILLTLVLLSAFTGCGTDSKEDGDAAAPDAIRVGIIQLADNGAFTAMREGFISRMRALGYTEDKMVFDYKNANGDTATLNSICQIMVEDRKDFIVSIATPPSQAIVNMDSGIPVFFISVAIPSEPDHYGYGRS
jgi:putative ABC transport system substrate-binding protein